MDNIQADSPQVLSPIEDQIATFFKAIGTAIHIFTTSQHDGTPFGRYFGNDIEAVSKFVFDMNVGRNNIYFTPNVPEPNCGHRPKKPQIVRIRAAYVDIDTYKAGTRFDKDAAHRKVMQDNPSLVIDSGNGLHVYWILAESVEATPENVAMLETVNRALVARYGGDPAAIPVNQVLRVPGTVNWPNETKRKIGRVPCMAKVLYGAGSAIGNPTLAQLRDAFVTDAAPTTSTNTGNVIATRSDVDVIDTLLNARNDAKAVPLYNGDRSGYASPSEADMALLCIITHYTEDRSQVARVYKATAMFRSSKYDGRDDLLEMEIEKAFARNAAIKAFAGFAGSRPDAFGGFAGATPKGVAENPWPDPIALPSGLAPVAPFQSTFLPNALAPYVGDISDRMQCPPDFPAVAVVIAAGALIGNRIAVRPKLKDTWAVTPNLWGLVVGRPGVRKSPAINETLAPLKRFENLALKENATALAAHKREIQQYAIRLKTAEAAYKKNENPNAPIDFPDEPAPPKQKRIIVNDATYERLGEIARDNPHGILSYRDEISSLFQNLSREENAPARSFYLTGWNGTDSYTFDRIMRGHQHVETLCISMLGSIQPGKLATHIGRAHSGGEGDDGLIQRFGLLVWPDQSNTWKNVDRYPDGNASALVNATFDRLHKIELKSPGGEYDINTHRLFVSFDAAAAFRFVEWQTSLEERLRSNELNPSIESHLAKYTKLVPALALMNQLCDHGIGTIGVDALNRAIAFAVYLETHAIRAYRAGLRGDAASAQAILARIRKGDLPGEFTARDIYQRDWSNLTDRDAVKLGLELLVDHHWLRALPAPGHPTGGRPTTRYQVNPKAFA